MRPASRRNGFTLITLMAFVAVMGISMLAAERAWSSLLQQDLEDELIFRGEQYVEALDAYRKKKGTLPTQLDQLIKDKPRHIRQLYPEPMTPEGEWYLIHPGDPILNPPAAQSPQGQMGILNEGIFARKVGGETPGFGQKRVGPIIGVSSLSEKSGFKSYNGRSQYNQWFFLVEPAQDLAKRREKKKLTLLRILGVHQVPSVPTPAPPFGGGNSPFPPPPKR